MLTEAFTLVLQLPPLAFNGPRPPHPFQPPRELTCPVQALGRRWIPLAPQPSRTSQIQLNPNDLRLHEPPHLVTPLTDFLLLLALSGLASSTGGKVDFRSWSDRHPGLVTPPLYAPMMAKPGF